jgi:hypothetical protein
MKGFAAALNDPGLQFSTRDEMIGALMITIPNVGSGKLRPVESHQISGRNSPF